MTVDTGAQAREIMRLTDFSVTLKLPGGDLPAILKANLTVHAGEVVAVVGESGSGKSVTVRALMGLLGDRAELGGSVVFNGAEQISGGRSQLGSMRGIKLGMIFQEPLSAFNPTMRVGNQIVEAITIHNPRMARKEARARALSMLERVAMPDPVARFAQYPHEFSGGMLQRAMIAMAMINKPELLIADEPTTALDVTTQAQVVSLMKDLCKAEQNGLILITHDLGLVAGVADRVVVMYSGLTVEDGDVDSIFYRPRHPYTAALLAALPASVPPGEPLSTIAGLPPRLDDRPSGCPYRTRCPYATEVCASEVPSRTQDGETYYACFHPLNTTVSS